MTPSRDQSSMRQVDSDSLSVILSFLPTRDFLRATRISKEWRRISDRPAAWPKRLETSEYIDLLLSDDIDNSHRRRLDVKWSKDLLHKNAHSMNPHFKQATEICVNFVDWKVNPLDGDEQLPIFPIFPSCTALTLLNRNYLTRNWLLTQHGSQLKFLSLIGGQAGYKEFVLPVRSLTGVRILVTDHTIQNKDLEQFTGLEYLHLSDQWNPDSIRSIFQTVRMLSLKYQLRHFSLSGDGPRDKLALAITNLYQDGTTKVEDCDTTEYPPALLHSLSIVTPMGLLTLELGGLLSRLPTLRDLTCTIQGNPGPAVAQPDSILDVSRLRKFKLVIQPVKGTIPIQLKLFPSDTLQSFILEQRLPPYKWGIPTMDLKEFLCRSLSSLPNLTELSWSDSDELPKSESLQDLLFQSLPNLCPKLKRMDITVFSVPSLDILSTALSKIGTFETLELTVFPSREPFHLPRGLLVAVGASKSWRQLIVHIGCIGVKPPVIQPGHMTFDWYIENHQTIDGPTMEEILAHLHDPSQSVEVQRRILDFRLWRYGSEIQCFKPQVNRQGKFEWQEV